MALALDSLSYSGRLVQTNGAPVSGTVILKADLAYTNALGTPLCTKTIPSVTLSKGVFHIKLDFDCTLAGKTLTQVLSDVPANQSVAIQITDVTNSKSYSFQAIHAVPYANVASIAAQLEQNGAGDGEFLKWDDGTKQWKPGTVSGASGGTVTSVSANGPLSVTTPTSTPAISIQQANSSQSGYLSAADWNTFNSKEGTLLGGTTAQYYRGDKSWQTLDSSVVPENVNLYFTNARVLGVPLSGFVTAAGAIDATDTTLQAFGKTQGQINAINSAAANYLIKNSTDSVTGVVNVGTTGLLQLVYVPVGMNDATNKSYVDSGDALKVSKAGDTMSGVLTLDSDLKIKGGSNYVTVKGHASSANYNFVLPSGAGTNGQFLQTDGSGNLSWVAQSSTASPTGAAGGDLAGSYPNPTVPGLASKLSTTLNSGNIFVGNGSNIATAVSVSGDATLSNAGVLTLANTAVTAGTYSSVIVDGKGRVTGGTNPVVVTGVSVTAPITNTGTAAVPLIGMPAATGGVDGYLTSANFTTFNNKQNAITAATNLNTGSVTTNLQNALNVNPFGAGAGNTGEIRFYELTANGTNYTGFKSPNVLAADVIYTLPSADGTSGQVLSTNASGVLSWTSIPSSMAPNGSAGGGLTGSYPNPTIASGLDAAKLSAGNVSNTEFDYLDGVTSSIQTQLNGKQTSDTGLTNLAAFNTNGILVQTANDTFAGRSIVGTTNRLVVTNGDGVSGNPTINIDTNLLPSPTGAGQWLKSTAANVSAWTTLVSSDITTALGFTPINKAGDSVTTGTIALSGTAALTVQNPVNVLDAVNKQYVDGFGQWTKSGSDIYRSGGNVGIGTTSPLNPLHIVGTGANILQLDQFSSDAIAPAFRTRKARGTQGTPSQILANDRLFGIYGTSYHDTGWATNNTVAIQGFSTEVHTSTSQGTAISFETTSSGAIARSERMRIDSTGNIGIGTSTPIASLDILSRQSTSAVHPYRAGIITKSEGSDVGGRVQVQTNSTVEGPLFMGMRGRGTIAVPTAVQAGDALVELIGFGHDGSNYVGSGQGRFRIMAEQNWTVGSNSTYAMIGTTAVGQANDTERMRITSAGNVGIGTAAPTAKLEVAGNAKVTGDLFGAVKDTSGNALKSCAGRSGTTWTYYSINSAITGSCGAYIDVSTAACGFSTVFKYFPSLGGNGGHWTTTGGSSVYSPTATSFRVYINVLGSFDGTTCNATTLPHNSSVYYIDWLAVGM